ncbi:MAG: uracil-DNA glycosylase [Acidimicrobiia bacterium]
MNREPGLTRCRACPRLVDWRERVAAEKRAAFLQHDYWGKPVPSFGDPAARLLIVGLAPAAHGANRTGRMFTGDRSGAFLFASLHRTGFSNKPIAVDRDDGLVLWDCLITAAVRCAPPANRPSPGELENCTRWLLPELTRTGIEVIVALGGVGFGQVLRLGSRIGWRIPTPRPRFGHGTETTLVDGPTLLGCYHPSQQNTFTGKLTEPMIDGVFERARTILSRGRSPTP